MSRPLSRLLVAGTSALSITALTLGLAAPAGAAPVNTPSRPEGVSAALDELRESPIVDLVPAATADQLTRIAAQRAPASRMAAATASSNVTAEELARTETSATFRFTLPEGEVTREGAVLQAYSIVGGLRSSDLNFLTNPVGQDGVDHYASYAEQTAIGLAMVDLLRENFSITGATVVTGGVNDHLVIPAGRNSFEITVTSARTESELLSAIEAITGDSSWNHTAPAWIIQSRLAFPEPELWTYGERVDVMPTLPTLAQFPNGANELTALIDSSPDDVTLSVKRQDENPFSGDRALRLDNSNLFGGGLTGTGGDAFFELLMEWTPPPLRLSNPTTVVTGATPVGDNFYRPNVGVSEVTATTTYDGPRTLEEAQAGFTTWVTETCDADMSDPIPGFSQGEEDEPMTWQEYLDTLGYSDSEPFETSPPLYTGPEYIGSALVSIADHNAAFRLLFKESAGDENGMFANLFDWEAACGVSEGPGDGDDPGDTQTPASISVDVPSAGVAGQPITLSATVSDAAGKPVAGQDVTFTIDEKEAESGTLRAAALALDPAADNPTTLTAKTDSQGVATVQYTPSTSGTLHITASTGGTNPVATDAISLVTITPRPGDGDDDGDTGGGGGNQSGSGSLGSLFGSLGS